MRTPSWHFECGSQSTTPAGLIPGPSCMVLHRGQRAGKGLALGHVGGASPGTWGNCLPGGGGGCGPLPCRPMETLCSQGHPPWARSWSQWAVRLGVQQKPLSKGSSEPSWSPPQDPDPQSSHLSNLPCPCHTLSPVTRRVR